MVSIHKTLLRRLPKSKKTNILKRKKIRSVDNFSRNFSSILKSIMTVDPDDFISKDLNEKLNENKSLNLASSSQPLDLITLNVDKVCNLHIQDNNKSTDLFIVEKYGGSSLFIQDKNLSCKEIKRIICRNAVIIEQNDKIWSRL